MINVNFFFAISADILNESQVEPDSTTLEPDSSLHAHLRHASLQTHLDFISEGQDDDYGVIELGKSLIKLFSYLNTAWLHITREESSKPWLGLDFTI